VKRATIPIAGDLENAVGEYTNRQEVAPAFTALVQAALSGIPGAPRACGARATAADHAGNQGQRPIRHKPAA